MKALQAGLLVVVGALGAFVFMRWKSSEPAPAPVMQEVKPPEAKAPEIKAPEVKPEPTTPEAPPVAAQPSSSPKTSAKPSAKFKPPQKPAPVTTAHHEPAQPPPAPPPVSSTPVVSPPPAVEPAPPVTTAAPPPPPPPPPLRKVVLKAGTLLPVRLIESVSSDRNKPGDTFTCSLDEELAVDGLVIAERGARCEGRVMDAARAGKVKGLSSIEVELTQLMTSDGQRVEIQTESFAKKGADSKGSDAAKIGGGAALGAIIGAIAGGGKGAAVGAAAGGAAGTGGVLMTRGKAAVINSETKLSFRLREPVTVTERRKRN